MMISPEAYYEFNLKGKSAEQIMSAIRGLKQEIGHLKNTMEHPEYGSGFMIEPSESTQLWCTRLYLERAKQALTEEGVVYKPSQAEQKAMELENNIPFISKITFEIGGYFGGYTTRVISFDSEELLVRLHHTLCVDPDIPQDEFILPMDKDEFFDELRSLHIGEWRRSYRPERFGYSYCDGTQWEMEILFSNGAKPFKSCGDNSYPYNFDEFQELLGITIAGDVEEEDDESATV